MGKRRLTMLTVAWRSLSKRPGRTLLTLLGVALGVAAILATSITNRSVSSTLDGLFQRTLGGAELQVIPLGDQTLLEETVLQTLERMPQVRLAVPTIRTTTVLAGALGDGEGAADANGNLGLGKSLQIVGIDPLLEPQMRLYTLAAGRMPKAGEYEALLPQSFADHNDLKLGGDLALFGPNGTERLEICGLLKDEGAALSSGGEVAFIPIDVIRDIFALERGYSEISLQTQPEVGGNPQALGELKSALETRLRRIGRLIYPAGRADLVPRMSSAYRMALSFFSILALYMGAFLIYNTFATTVVERTQEIGLLRAIGMRRRQVLGQVLTEALLLALLGCLLGVAGGALLANGLMALMRGFFQVEAPGMPFTPLDLLTGLAVGLVGTFLAAFLPARQASRISPVEALAVRSRSDQGARSGVWKIGLALLAGGAICLFYPPDGDLKLLVGVRMAAFIVILFGLALTVPLGVQALEPLNRRLARLLFGVMGSLGARNVQRSVLRTMVTVASLAISLILIIEVDSLVHILKQDVGDWVDNALGADILVRAPYPMEQTFARSLESLPGVLAASPSRTIEVKVADESVNPSKKQDERLYFVAVDPGQFRRVGGKELVAGQGDPAAAWAQLEQGGALFVSSVVADEYDLAQGSQLWLQTRRGAQPFSVAGVSTEFDQDGLVVTGSFNDLRRLFGESRADLFSLRVDPESEVDQVARAIGERYEKREGVQVQTTRSFKDGVMRFYDRLTGLFNVLVLVGVLIGTMGLLNTMTMNILERRRELAMLRSLGSLRRQVVKMVLAEALIIGVVSALYAVLFGYFLSHVLLNVTNLISGYDLRYAFSLRPYLICLLIALGVSQLAALAPARSASRVNIIDALKHE